MASAMLAKACTYGTSAVLHLYPFGGVSSLIWAFRADLLCVPLAAFGHVVPVANDVWFEVHVAAAVMLLNAAFVAHQTYRQVADLQTPPDRSDTPRFPIRRHCSGIRRRITCILCRTFRPGNARTGPQGGT